MDHPDEDLKKMTVPTLIIHGDDDQIVPIGASAQAAVKIAPKAQLKVYSGGPHRLCTTHKDQVNADLLAFLKGRSEVTQSETGFLTMTVVPLCIESD